MDFPFWVTIAPFISKDAFHTCTYGTPKKVKCNYQQMAERGDSGENIVRTTWMALPAKTKITENDQITLNGNIIPITTIQYINRESDHKLDYIRLELSNNTQWV